MVLCIGFIDSLCTVLAVGSPDVSSAQSRTLRANTRPLPFIPLTPTSSPFFRKLYFPHYQPPPFTLFPICYPAIHLSICLCFVHLLVSHVAVFVLCMSHQKVVNIWPKDGTHNHPGDDQSEA